MSNVNDFCEVKTGLLHQNKAVVTQLFKKFVTKISKNTPGDGHIRPDTTPHVSPNFSASLMI